MKKDPEIYRNLYVQPGNCDLTITKSQSQENGDKIQGLLGEGDKMKVVKNYSEYLGSIEVAKLLDVTPDDVNCMARKGDLSGFKEGRIWRFNKQTVDRWIKAHKLSETT